MPRTALNSLSGPFFHVLNQRNARDEIFGKDAEFAAVENTATPPKDRPTQIRPRILDLSPFHHSEQLYQGGPKIELEIPSEAFDILNKAIRIFHPPGS